MQACDLTVLWEQMLTKGWWLVTTRAWTESLKLVRWGSILADAFKPGSVLLSHLISCSKIQPPPPIKYVCFKNKPVNCKAPWSLQLGRHKSKHSDVHLFTCPFLLLICYFPGHGKGAGCTAAPAAMGKGRASRKTGNGLWANSLFHKTAGKYWLWEQSLSLTRSSACYFCTLDVIIHPPRTNIGCSLK